MREEMHHIQFGGLAAQKIPLISPEHLISSVFSFSSHCVALRGWMASLSIAEPHRSRKGGRACIYMYTCPQRAGSIWSGCGLFIQQLPLAFLPSNAFSLRNSRVCSNIWSWGGQPRVQGRHWLCLGGRLSDHKYSYFDIFKIKKIEIYLC